MPINPDEISTVRVGQLPPEGWNLTDLLPHEISSQLKQGTVQGLANLISTYIGAVSSLALNSTVVNDGETLPATTSEEFMFVGKGTFHNVGGGQDIVTTEPLNVLTSNGSVWSLAVAIPVNVELAGIVQTIRSGFTTTTPSENAVYDALSLKANVIDVTDALNSKAGLSTVNTFTNGNSFNGGLGVSDFFNIYSNIDLYNDTDQSFFFRNLLGTQLHAFRSVKSNPSGNKANGIYLQNDISSKVLNVSDDGNLYYDGDIIWGNLDKNNIIGTPTTATNQLFYGDSVTAGAVATSPDKTWTALICAVNETTQLNYGYGGSTMCYKYPGDMSFTERLPSIATYDGTQQSLFIAYGVNDYVQDWTATQFGDALSNALVYLMNTKNYPPSALVVVTPAIIKDLPYDKNNEGLKAYAEIAIEKAKINGVRYVNTYQYMMNNGGQDALVSPDNIHPNDAGHAIIAEAVTYKYFGNLYARGQLKAGKSIYSMGSLKVDGKSEFNDEVVFKNIANDSRIGFFGYESKGNIQGANNDNTATKDISLQRFGSAVLIGTGNNDSSGAALQVAGAVSASNGVQPYHVATLGQVNALSRPYKVYTALLSQTGTSAPTATVLENTLGGTIIWTRTGIGTYVGTLSGVFTANKTAVFFTKTAMGGAQHTSSAYSPTTSTVIIINSSPGGDADIAGDNSAIEIRVYN